MVQKLKRKLKKKYTKIRFESDSEVDGELQLGQPAFPRVSTQNSSESFLRPSVSSQPESTMQVSVFRLQNRWDGKLRDAQVEVLERWMGDSPYLLWVSPTGSGKTYPIPFPLWCESNLRPRSLVLVVTPLRSLGAERELKFRSVGVKG